MENKRLTSYNQFAGSHEYRFLNPNLSFPLDGVPIGLGFFIYRSFFELVGAE